jgi:pimeloyl-ACP methyl ester carboxylesterase
MRYAYAGDGTRLGYDVTGGGPGGPAVLLVMGLAFRGVVWGETREVLAAAGYRTITMDNRGAGESEPASFDFSTSTMADDAVEVLRQERIARAHVVGVSLGGMIAQELVLRHPARVGALVLQSTTAGARATTTCARARPALRALLRERVLDRPERRARVALRVLTTRRYARRADLSDPRNRSLIDAVEHGISPSGYLGQVAAATSHRAWRRLGRIQAPTLVQHGDRDAIIRAAAGRALARRIPDATLHVYRGAGHALAIQCPESIREVVDFVRARDALLAA